MSTLSINGSALIGACSMLREDPDMHESDWISIALRTITVLRMDGATLSIATPEQIERELKRRKLSLKDYAYEMAGTLIYLSSDRAVHIADEIARDTKRAIRHHNVSRERRYANAS